MPFSLHFLQIMINNSNFYIKKIFLELLHLIVDQARLFNIILHVSCSKILKFLFYLLVIISISICLFKVIVLILRNIYKIKF